MSMSDLLELPPGAMIGFLLLIWPAIWAGALAIVALAGDFARQNKNRTMHAVGHDHPIRGSLHG